MNYLNFGKNILINRKYDLANILAIDEWEQRVPLQRSPWWLVKRDTLKFLRGGSGNSMEGALRIPMIYSLFNLVTCGRYSVVFPEHPWTVFFTKSFRHQKCSY